MNEAVIVSTARTPIGKAYRGAFNDTEAPVLGGHVIRAALKRIVSVFAGQGVAAIETFQAVCAAVPDDQVVQLIADPVDHSGARQFELLQMCAQGVGDAAQDAVGSAARLFDHHVAGVIDNQGVIADAADQSIGTDATV